MTRVTSKLQVTIPKAIANRYGITPGTDIVWLPARDAIRVVVPASDHAVTTDRMRRLELFDQASRRQRDRETARPRPRRRATGRGWRREELYSRDHAR